MVRARRKVKHDVGRGRRGVAVCVVRRLLVRRGVEVMMVVMMACMMVVGVVRVERGAVRAQVHGVGVGGGRREGIDVRRRVRRWWRRGRSVRRGGGSGGCGCGCSSNSGSGGGRVRGRGGRRRRRRGVAVVDRVHSGGGPRGRWRAGG